MKRAVGVGVLLVVLVAGLLVFLDHRREQAHGELVEAGEAALARGEVFAAIESFSGAIAVKPDAMIGYLKRGEAYHRRGELDAALRDLRRAVELDPYAPRIHELLGDVNHELRRFDRAAERFAGSVALDDQSPRVLYKLALARFAGGQPEAAAAAAGKALELDERVAEAHYLLGLSLRDLGRFEEAAAALQRSVSLAPALLQAREALGNLYGQMGRADDRIAQLEALRALDASASREIALAMAYARTGRTDYAIAALGRALERYPDYPHTRVALGRIWLEIAEARQDHVALGKARGALEPAAAEANTSDALTLFGRTLLRAEEVERAEGVLQQATLKRPVDPAAFVYLAEAAERLGHPMTAMNALLDRHALVGEEPDGRRRAAFAARVASLAAQADDHALAAFWCARALADGAGDPSLLVRCAESQAATGDAVAANATLARVLERDPAHRGALALQRRLR